jgi:cell volume regulation protein A
MNNFYLLVLLAALMVGLSLVAGLYSSRLGFSHMLVFLLMGMAVGVDGPLGLPFNSSALSSGMGHLALALILLDGGLRTPARAVRQGLWPASLLATVGVLVTSALAGAVAWWTLGMDWRLAWLLGAVIASTDAAAVFSQLHSHGIHLPLRLSATIEVESGLNDPMAVFLTLSLLTLLLPPAHPTPWTLFLACQVGWGLAVGGLGAWAFAAALQRLPLKHDHDGLSALLLAASGLAIFALAGCLEGSGFLAVYVFGLIVGHRARSVVAPALSALNGYTWLAQASLFLLLGLLVTPHQVLRMGWPAVLIAAALMLLARPLAVMLCLTPLRFAWREQVFIAWVGLRGAVPIVLALFPVMAGVDRAYQVLDAAFVVVLASLLLQGPSLGWLARKLGLHQAGV